MIHARCITFHFDNHNFTIMEARIHTVRIPKCLSSTLEAISFSHPPPIQQLISTNIPNWKMFFLVFIPLPKIFAAVESRQLSAGYFNLICVLNAVDIIERENTRWRTFIVITEYDEIRVQMNITDITRKAHCVDLSGLVVVKTA